MNKQGMDDIAAVLSKPTRFREVDWNAVPDTPGAYVISTDTEVLYVGMAGRDGKGSLRRRLRDHASGQIVNMFAQYLFLARVQFAEEERIVHPTKLRVRAARTSLSTAHSSLWPPRMVHRLEVLRRS